MKRQDLSVLYNAGILSRLDIHFATLTARLAGTDVPEVSLAAALVSSYTREGHICLDLSSVQGKQLLKRDDGEKPVVCPELKEWCKKLKKSIVVGNPGQYKPIVLDDRFRLYLFRYWDYQEKLVESIRRRVNEDKININVAALRDQLQRLFPVNDEREMDWQKVSGFAAVMKKFCVISGGPGTGKTTTAAKILALLVEQANSEKVRIALAAPTGKAAARLQETIKLAKDKLNSSDTIKEAIPEEASTIHRLLGSIPDSPYFRHNAQNPLPADVVVVDEASMVAMALMSKLIQALPSRARLILLGDKDQLASVEAGAVLGDICDTGNSHSFSEGFCKDVKEVTGYEIENSKGGRGPTIQDCIVQLRKNYRFGNKSGIGAVSYAVNAGDDGLAMELLASGKYDDIRWTNLPQYTALRQTIRDIVLEGFGDYLRARDPIRIFQLFERFRILCALRKGPYGVTAINFFVEEILEEKNLIKPEGEWYAGRPVLITRNDYNMRLFNGDVGIVLRDKEARNEFRAFFPSIDGTLRKFHPLRLPEHETVFAMTIHKSQGSEFDKVLLILPERESPVLSRELLYTGITRAKERVHIWGTEDIFRTAVSRHTERTSGLRDALWES
ncbi:exodeoxyribonuclease V subunit alpha [Thermodesulfobacteriota bacterium]